LTRIKQIQPPINNTPKFKYIDFCKIFFYLRKYFFINW